MKIFSLYFLFSFISINIYAQEIKFENLKKDKDLVAYKTIVEDVKNKIISKHFIVPKNFASLASKNGISLPIDSLKIVLKRNGMLNGDEFIDLVNKQQVYLMTFFKNHTEIQKLEPSKKSELFMKILSN